jgi:hypothetical protein
MLRFFLLADSSCHAAHPTCVVLTFLLAFHLCFFLIVQGRTIITCAAFHLTIISCPPHLHHVVAAWTCTIYTGLVD